MTSFRSTWQSPLPDDEIARQQRTRENLVAGMQVHILDMGAFVYAGIWDTMHSFYPAEGQDLYTILPAEKHRYVRRDPAGRPFLQLPYTILADHISL